MITAKHRIEKEIVVRKEGVGKWRHKLGSNLPKTGGSAERLKSGHFEYTDKLLCAAYCNNT